MGALIMAHSDDNGLVLPPRLAPTQVVMIPIYKGEEELRRMVGEMETVAAKLKAKGITVKIDDRDNVRSGFKFAEYELKGFPVRIVIGLRDLAAGTAEVMRRDTLEKETVPIAGIEDYVNRLLAEIQDNIYQKALKFRDSMITKVDTFEEFTRVLDEKGGFVLAPWDGTTETEIRIKELTKATIRCIPFDSMEEGGVDMLTGKPSQRRVLFARSY